MTLGYLLAEKAKAAASPDILIDICTQSIIEAPDDISDLISIGIIARNSGLLTQAKYIFNHVLSRDKQNLFAYYELSFTHLLLGDHLDAVFSLKKILYYRPRDVRANLLAARMLFMVGDRHGAKMYLNAIDTLSSPADPGNQDSIDIVAQFGRFVEEFPIGRTLQTVRAIEEGPKHLNAHGVFDQINLAVRDERGFCVLRAGDGEGAFIRISNVDETNFAALYENNRKDRARVWFADTLDIWSSGFCKHAFTIKKAISNADIVGMPYENWLRHEYRIASFTGVTGLVNIFRDFQINSNQYTCSQNVHIDLQQAGLLSRIMASQKSIGLISCQTELPQLLKSKFNFRDVWYHYVPGEKGHSHLLESRSIEGAHWPDEFYKIMEKLSVPLGGRVYLVAAGILGKLYCAKIKESGGIAIDVGSVADGWMGSKTRPGLPHFDLLP